MTPQFRFADLFSGCGGMSFGFHHHRAFRGVLAVDHWEAAERVYSHNLPGTPFVVGDMHDGDVVRSVVKQLRGNCDVLLGGPPCQGFSTLGKRRDNDARSQLVDVFLRVACEVAPPVVIMENVRGISSKAHATGGTFIEFARRTLSEGAKVAYDVVCVLLNATEFGMAQTRQRWVLIGVRRDIGSEGELLAATIAGVMRQRSKKPRVLRDVIGDLPVVHPGGGAEEIECGNGSVVYNHRSLNHSEKLIKAFDTVPVDGGLLDVPREFLTPHLQRMVAGHYGNGGHIKNIYGRLNWEKPSGTVVAGIDKITCGRFVHPDANRLLTPRECARLQSFPDTFRFFGGLVTQYYLIGNAVPPRFSTVLANAVGAQLSEALGATKRSTRSSGVAA